MKNVKEVLSAEKVLEAENKQLRIAVRDYGKEIASLHDKLLIASPSLLCGLASQSTLALPAFL